jgi:Fe-S cluster assembly scaffold protein SufB
MSSEIHVKLKRKGQSYEDAITLMYLSTTAIRELAQEVSFVFAGGQNPFEEKINTQEPSEEQLEHEKEYGAYTVLTKEKLDEIISFYDRTIVDVSSRINKQEEEIEKLEKMLPLSSNTEVFDRIREEMNDSYYLFNELTESLEEYQNIRNKWIFSVFEVFENNKAYSSIYEDFELVYYRD